MQFKISIIIPVYNSQKYLGDCLDSVCHEVSSDVEIILINDGSKDNSKKICLKYENNHDAIKFINLNKNKGVGYCRQLACRIAKGKFICFLDSDDKLLKNSVKNFLYQIGKYNKMDLFILRNTILGNDKIDKNQIFIDTFNNLRSKPLINYISNFNKFRPTCWNYLINNDFLKKNNISFSDNVTSEDWPFVAKITALAKNFKIINKPSYVYRKHTVDSLSSSHGFKAANAYLKTFLEIEYFLNKNKHKFNKLTIIFLYKFLQDAINCLLSELIICKENEIKIINKFFVKNNLVFKRVLNNKLIKKTFIFNRKKNTLINLLNYKEQKINTIKKKFKKLNIDKLILFCASRTTGAAIDIFKTFDANIVNILDNNFSLSNQKMSNIKILHPDKFFNSKKYKKKLKMKKKISVVVCEQNQKHKKIKSIIAQLRNSGILRKNILFFDGFNLLTPFTR